MTSATDLSSNYAVFDGHLSFGKKPALIIIDFVQAYLEESSPLYAGVESTLQSAIRMLAAARKASIPVIHTRVLYTPGGLDGGVFYRKLPLLKVFEQGSPLGQFASGLEPLPNEVVVTKNYASAFFGTSLSSTLTAQGIDTLIITGLSTSGCVRATATDACQHGFLPMVVRQAVGDRHQQVHEANLFDLQAKYAEVVDEEQTVEYLNAISSSSS